MNKTILLPAAVVLAVAGLIIGHSPQPDQYPLGEKVLVETTPRIEEESPFTSQLLWMDDVVEYDGANSVSVRWVDWPYDLKSVCLATEAWSIYVSRANISMMWCDPDVTVVFVDEDEDHPTDLIH